MHPMFRTTSQGRSAAEGRGTLPARRALLILLLGAMLGSAVFVGTRSSDSGAAPARQSLGEVPEGITVEPLATASALPFGPGDVDAVLLRYTYAPGARLDVQYAGPILVYIESGTLSLEGVGEQVSILAPRHDIEQPLTGPRLGKRQKGKAPHVGSRAEVAAGGSVYAETGELGPTSNQGDDVLRLLVVQFVSESPPVDVTKIAIEGPDEP